MTPLATIGFKADITGLKQAERGLDSLANKGEKTEKRINKSVDRTNESFNSLRSTIGLAGAALAAIGSATLSRELIAQSDAWKNINSQIRQVTNSEKELVGVRKELLTLSKDTRSDLTNTVDLYATLTRSTKDLGTSQAEVFNVTKTLNNLFVAGGKPISEVSGAIRQLAQGFAAGALRGDEFNSVAEGAPKIMDALAAKLEMTRGELREFAATGGITAQVMIDALKDYSTTAQTLADQTTKTWGQSIENATTNITEFVGQSELLNDAVDATAQTVEDLSGELTHFSDELERWTSQFAGFGEDATKVIEGTSDTFSRELMALGAITDETVKLLTGAIVEFPANVRAMTKILAVELAYAADMIINFGVKAVNAIREPFMLLPTLVKAHIKAFGNVLGTEFGAIVKKAKIYGEQIQDALNPFDGDTFDHEKALQQADDLARGMTAAYLKAADDQVNAARLARDEELDLSEDNANARITAANAARDGSIAAILAQRDATIKAFDEMGKKSEEASFKISTKKGASSLSKKVNKDTKELDKLTKAVQNFGGEWSRTGNIIADSFGGAADAMENFGARMKKVGDLRAELNAQLAHENTTLEQSTHIKSQLADLDRESVSAQLSGAAAIASVTSKMFKENSKERKALHAIEMGFAAAEIAIATEKALVNAVAAVTTQGQGDPYSAFARVAAMMGVMAGVLGAAGIAFSSGGGAGGDATQSRQDKQGTGSLLGSDEKSNSISAAQDMFEDIQLDQLAELRGIRSSMSDLANGIALATRTLISGNSSVYNGDLSGSQSGSGVINIAEKLGLSSVLGAFGDNFIGKALGSLFGTTKKKITDQGIQFIAGSLGDIMESGVLAAQSFFDITKTKKKLFGLSKKVSTSTETQAIGGDFEQQIGSIFASIGEAVGTAADLLGFDVANALATFQVNLGKISLEGLTGEEIEKELQAVFSQQADLIAGTAIPALKKYQEVGEGAFETLMRVTKEQSVFNDAMSMIGKSFTDLSSIMQIDVAQSIVGLVGGLDKFSELTGEYFSEFFSESEQFAFLTAQLGETFAQLGKEIPATRDGFRALVDGLDLTTEKGQETFAILMQLVPGMTAYYSELERANGLTADYTQSLNEAMQALSQSISLEKDRAAVVLQAASEAHAAELSRIGAQREAILAQDEAARTTLDSATEALNKSFDAERDLINSKLALEKDAIKQASDARVSGLNTEKALLNDRKSGLSAIASQMSSLANRLAGFAGVGKSQDIGAALQSAKRGDFSAAQGLNGALPSTSNFSSAAEAGAAQGLAQNQLLAISKLAGNEADSAKSQLASLDNIANILTFQMEATKANAIDLMAAADTEAEKQLKALLDQQNALLGIDTSTLSLAEATKAYQEAQAQLDSLHTEEMLARLDDDLDLANQTLELAQKTYDDEISRLDLILENAQTQIDTLLGIDNSVLSVVDAIYNLQSIVNQPPEQTEQQQKDKENKQAEIDFMNSQLKREKQQEQYSIQIADSMRRQEQLLRKIELNGAPL